MKLQISIPAVMGCAIACAALQASAANHLYPASPSDLQPHQLSTEGLSSYDLPLGHEDWDVGEPLGQGHVPPQGPAAFHHGAPGCCVDETPLQRFRNSAYQGTTLSGGVLSDGGNDALTISHYDVSARFALPIDGMDNVLLITPGYRQDFIDAPTGVDIPDSLYATGVSFTWLKTLSDRWKATTVVAPSVRSDFQTSEEAFRIFGLGLLTYECVPDTLSVSAGVAYLDRDDIPLLPVLGLSWRPTPEWNFDLNFPRPRIARRIEKCGAISESWVYTGVGLGGNTWAVERADGSSDVLTLRDYQWIFGWEHLRSGGRGMFVEGGAAFGRTLEYDRTDEEVDFDNALFVQAGITL